MSKNTKQIYFILILLIFIITFNMVRAKNVEPLREPEITNIGGNKFGSTEVRMYGSLGDKEARKSGLPAVEGSAEVGSLGERNLTDEVTNINGNKRGSAEARMYGSLGDKEARKSGLPAVAGSAEVGSLGERSLAEEITNISNKKYYPAVKEILDKSEKSIFVVMYIISIDENNTQSDVYQLCASLVNAKKRGVEVKVILDQTINYKRLKSADEWQNEGGNQNAFRFFKNNEIDVVYDTKAIHIHSKAIVVDENIAILGSDKYNSGQRQL